MSGDLQEVVRDGVALLTLNRPDRLNAMSQSMLDGLEEALPRLADDGSIGVVVLTGAGRGFCAGGDVRAMAEGSEMAGATLEERAPGLRARMEVSRYLHEMPKPTIAVVRGAAAAPASRWRWRVTFGLPGTRRGSGPLSRASVTQETSVAATS